MVANYNMTWKTPCLEILGYVRGFASWGGFDDANVGEDSLRSARLGRLLLLGRLLSYGGSGLRKMRVAGIVSGRGDRRQRLRIISGIGKLGFFGNNYGCMSDHSRQSWRTLWFVSKLFCFHVLLTRSICRASNHPWPK